jgi:hypothetical protein
VAKATAIGSCPTGIVAKRAKVKRSLLTRNPREVRAREVADCRESSVKKCHVISRVMNVTPDIGHLGPVSREESDNTFNCTAADGE